MLRALCLLCILPMCLCACAPATPEPQATDATFVAAPVATPKPTATIAPTEAPETLEQLQADLATASAALSTACQYVDEYYYYLMRGAKFESVLIRFSESLESEEIYRGGLNTQFTVLNGAVYIVDEYSGEGITRITADGEAECISRLDPSGSYVNSWYYATERYQYMRYGQYGGRILRVPNDPAYADWHPANAGDVDAARCLCLTGVNEEVREFVPYEGYLYYSRIEGASGMSLWRVLPDGSGKELVCDNVYYGGTLCLDDDGRLYYATKEPLYTYRDDICLLDCVVPGRQYLEPDGTLTAADYTAVYPVGADADYLYYDGGFIQVRAKADGKLSATKHEDAKGYRVSKSTGEKDLTYDVSLYWYTPVGDYLINANDALMMPKAGGEPVALPGSEAIRLEIERYARVPSVLISGEGSVKLELPGSSEYAIYYLLYHSDDITPGHEVRAVYLNHVSDGEMYFPPGNYVLKIARGDYWISDEEGFGASGTYSRSVPTQMTAGTYSIQESTTSGFGRDSWGGLG